MKNLIAPLLCFVVAFATVASVSVYAQAQGSAAGSGSAVATASPADQLHDPLTDPIGAFDQLKEAKRVGWAAAVGAILCFLALTIGTLGKTIGQLAWMGKGKWAIIVGLTGALGAGTYNAAMSGGSWTAVLVAAAIGAAAWWNARGPAQ